MVKKFKFISPMILVAGILAVIVYTALRQQKTPVTKQETDIDIQVENFDQSVEVNNEIAKIYDRIISIFNRVLSRNPSNEELAKWTDEIIEKNMNFEQIEKYLLTSREYIGMNNMQSNQYNGDVKIQIQSQNMNLIVSDIYKQIYGYEPTPDMLVILRFLYRALKFQDEKFKKFITMNKKDFEKSKQADYGNVVELEKANITSKNQNEIIQKYRKNLQAFEKDAEFQPLLPKVDPKSEPDRETFSPQPLSMEVLENPGLQQDQANLLNEIRQEAKQSIKRIKETDPKSVNLGREYYERGLFELQAHAKLADWVEPPFQQPVLIKSNVKM